VSSALAFLPASVEEKKVTHWRSRSQDRGAATLWVIIALPVFLALLCLVVEAGNAWLARVELETALESAALAAVQEWADTNDTDLARLRGQTLGLANCVRGEPLLLDLNNGGGGANDNLSCDGDIVLGRIDFENGMVIFNADESPGAGAAGITVSLCVRVQTTTDTRNDVANHECPFRVFNFQAFDAMGDPFNDLVIDFVRVGVVPPVNGNMQTAAFGDMAYYDLRQRTMGVGIGTDRDFGITPAPNPMETCPPTFLDVDLGLGGPSGVMGHTFSPAFGPEPPSRKSPTFTVNFTGAGADAFEPNMNDYFRFGVDTDCVGPNIGTGDNVAADRGGDFHGALVVVGFRFVSTNTPAGTIAGTLQLIDANSLVPGTPIPPPSLGDPDFGTYHASQICFENVPVGTGIYGVRTNKMVTVPSICCGLGGLAGGPFQVKARTFAMFESPGGPPRLLRVDKYICGGVEHDPCD
jgi:hypothetical protein